MNLLLLSLPVIHHTNLHPLLALGNNTPSRMISLSINLLEPPDLMASPFSPSNKNLNHLLPIRLYICITNQEAIIKTTPLRPPTAHTQTTKQRMIRLFCNPPVQDPHIRHRPAERGLRRLNSGDSGAVLGLGYGECNGGVGDGASDEPGYALKF